MAPLPELIYSFLYAAYHYIQEVEIDMGFSTREPFPMFSCTAILPFIMFLNCTKGSGTGGFVPLFDAMTTPTCFYNFLKRLSFRVQFVLYI